MLSYHTLHFHCYDLSITGNRRTNVGSGISSDHIVEMIPPIGTLGSNFFTSNLVERNQGVFKLMGRYLCIVIL